MPVDLKKALLKLDHPPSGFNWVRHVRETKAHTANAILAFVKGIPSFNYQTSSTAIHDELLFGIGMDAAVSVTQRGGAPAGRLQNKELVEAFFKYNETRRYPVGNCVEFERQWFRISRDILVPVSPLAVLREKGRFVPIFLCGWSELALDIRQRRLLMTVYEDAFLSLTDFQQSPAEFLFFPKDRSMDEPERVPEVWSRGDYVLLTQDELAEDIQRYLAARDDVRAILEKAQAEEAKRRSREDGTSPSQSDDLFGDETGGPKK
jgi:hypothetical protein